MAIPADQNQQNTEPVKANDKELNFRALEAKYQRQLEQERQARLEAEAKAQEALARKQQNDEDDDDDNEPYIDKKRLNKKLAHVVEKTKKETQQDIQQAVQQALTQERQNAWLKNNSDFHEVMSHAEKLYKTDPELAETILEMPEGFERQKLVYKNIKALGLHKEATKQPSIQEKIDANKRSPYYQPTAVGSPPYNSQGDFSTQGQKTAYDKMKELQSRLRI